MVVQDVSKLLVIARTIKNAFTPINRVPPEVLSLVPDYCRRSELVGLTHVCRRWREIFISCASLWTFLDCMNFDQTSAYLERSKRSPLEIRVEKEHILHGAFMLAISQIRRLKALILSGSSHSILKLTDCLISPAPLLEKLAIHVTGVPAAVIKSTLFGGDLQQLRILDLSGVITYLPWKNLSNLTTFYLHQMSGDEISVTHLLDFFERAPLLLRIKLEDSLPDSSDAPIQRVVPLPHLRSLHIIAEPAHSILLNHLYIPTGASVTLRFRYDPTGSPYLDYLPRSLDNLGNISHITSVNLDFNLGIALRLEGPSGALCVDGVMNVILPSDRRIDLQFLDKLPVSTTERLEIVQWDALASLCFEEQFPYQTLLPMNDIRTLMLIDCAHPCFITGLNPNRNTSNTMVCPKLEELVMYVQESLNESYIGELVDMAKERASTGAKLSTFVVDCPREPGLAHEAFVLKRYVPRAEHRLDGHPLDWGPILRKVGDTIPGWD